MGHASSFWLLFFLSFFLIIIILIELFSEFRFYTYLSKLSKKKGKRKKSFENIIRINEFLKKYGKSFAIRRFYWTICCWFCAFLEKIVRKILFQKNTKIFHWVYWVVWCFKQEPLGPLRVGPSTSLTNRATDWVLPEPTNSTSTKLDHLQDFRKPFIVPRNG